MRVYNKKKPLKEAMVVGMGVGTISSKKHTKRDWFKESEFVENDMEEEVDPDLLLKEAAELAIQEKGMVEGTMYVSVYSSADTGMCNFCVSDKAEDHIEAFINAVEEVGSWEIWANDFPEAEDALVNYCSDNSFSYDLVPATKVGNYSISF